ncbi:hypothetical protein [Demequina sp. NBRC 110057]|uniref:hypothetical protein n=1 Tax=Demequina sp. NBRC 110057 TaxID=1570346 RepID=UPI000A03D5FC|nr:hypothetical protein [Demequina sp. NBRC 110057]
MAVVSDRVRERAVEDFGVDSAAILSALERISLPGSVDPERVHAAILMVSRAHRGLFADAVEHAESDWRDLLDRAGLADAGWAEEITERFGPA